MHIFLLTSAQAPQPTLLASVGARTTLQVLKPNLSAHDELSPFNLLYPRPRPDLALASAPGSNVRLVVRPGGPDIRDDGGGKTIATAGAFQFGRDAGFTDGR